MDRDLILDWIHFCPGEVESEGLRDSNREVPRFLVPIDVELIKITEPWNPTICLMMKCHNLQRASLQRSTCVVMLMENDFLGARIRG